MKDHVRPDSLLDVDPTARVLPPARHGGGASLDDSWETLGGRLNRR